MGSTNTKLLYRVKTAADLLDISRSQAYKLIEDGTLTAVRIGKSIRVPAEAIQKLAGGARGAEAA
jgi:excisionase family DNA binding protein